MIQTIRIAAVLFLLSSTTNLAASDLKGEINLLLDYFANEWNQGELVSIESYFHPDFVLVTSDGVQTREQRISELKIVMAPGNDRGTLTFSDITIRALADDYAMGYGRTRLKFKDGTELGGMFSTIYLKTPFGWKAVLTHE